MMDADEVKTRSLWLKAEMERMREVQYGTREDMIGYLNYLWRALDDASSPQYIPVPAWITEEMERAIAAVGEGARD